MRNLHALAAAAIILAAAGGAAAQTTSPAPAAPAQPGNFIVNTLDGLPMECSLVSVSRGEVILKNTASGRDFSFGITSFDKESRDKVDAQVAALRRLVGPRKPYSLVLNAGHYANLSAKTPETRSTRTPLPVIKSGGFTAKDSAPVLETTASREIPPYGHIVFLSAQTPKNLPVEMPITARLYWYHLEDGSFVKEEHHNLLVTEKRGDFLFTPVTISVTKQLHSQSARSTAKTSTGKTSPAWGSASSSVSATAAKSASKSYDNYGGFVLHIVNNESREIIWEYVNGRDTTAYRRDALERTKAAIAEKK